jgi:hypothetical protein
VARYRLKPLSPDKHVIIYVLATAEGYERCAEMRHRTTEFSEEEVFAKHIPSTAENFEELLKTYLLSVFRIAKIVYEDIAKFMQEIQ